MNAKTIVGLIFLCVVLGFGQIRVASAGDDLDALLGGSHRIAAWGWGSYGIAGTTADFALGARQLRNRPARGYFRHTLVFQGLLIDFIGKVTCMAVDPEEGRAWIGGVVVANNSDNPNFQQDIHQPGRDVWFRVLDTGSPVAEPDRTTFLGFEGGGGIITSEEYCQLRLWPGPPDDEPNARTNALTKGKIKVRPKSGGRHGDDGDHVLEDLQFYDAYLMSEGIRRDATRHTRQAGATGGSAGDSSADPGYSLRGPGGRL